MKQKKIIVKEKKLFKEGKSEKGREWKLVGIVDQDELTFTTFNHENYLEGMSYDITYEEEEVTKGGRTFTSRRLIENKDFKQKVDDGFKDQVMGELKEIKVKLDELLGR